MKFLFVEDEPELLELYEILLDDIGIDFTLADNGKKALEYLENEHFDFVFSDIRMPVMDGFELLENIKNNDFFKLKQFIFMTAHVDISKEDAKSKGANDILYKPMGHKDLSAYVKELLD
jgi:CheY-like chemotaxis protein